METASEIKLFGKWTYDEVEVNDISLEDYIAVSRRCWAGRAVAGASLRQRQLEGGRAAGPAGAAGAAGSVRRRRGRSPSPRSRASTRCTCHTRLVATRRSASARPRAP
ncbi:hypothetical protein M885DRAFT_302908 [Pelagophyceae sp. CCMP2097]|nr:hypothetical protein M885DRAFT_302908 [Pelagophyceae sp. CCMP2097]